MATDFSNERSVSIIELEIRQSLAREMEWAEMHKRHSSVCVESTLSENHQPIESLESLRGDFSDNPAERTGLNMTSTPRDGYQHESLQEPESYRQEQPVEAWTYQNGKEETRANDGSEGVTVAEGGELLERTYSHPGEALILKEISEQKQREEELKQRWKSLGFELADHSLVDEDPPINEKENSGNPARFNHGNDDVDSAHFREVTGDTNGHHDQVTTREVHKLGQVRAEWDRMCANSEKKSHENERPQRQTSSGPRSARAIPNTIADSEDGNTFEPTLLPRLPFFAPQNETPIQREMREGKAREEALKRTRVLLGWIGQEEQSGSREDGEEKIELEVSIRRTPQLSTSGERDRTSWSEGGGWSGGGVSDDTMKMFAESRLQVELRREKERELALRRQGSINTISEERIGEPVKFFEILSAAANTERPPPRTPVAGERRRTWQGGFSKQEHNNLPATGSKNSDALTMSAENSEVLATTSDEKHEALGISDEKSEPLAMAQVQQSEALAESAEKCEVLPTCSENDEALVIRAEKSETRVTISEMTHATNAELDSVDSHHPSSSSVSIKADDLPVLQETSSNKESGITSVTSERYVHAERKETSGRYPPIQRSMTAPSSSDSLTGTRTLPKVLLTYSYAPRGSDDVTRHRLTSRDAADQRIEEEVAEFQKREAELRTQRETLKDTMTVGGTTETKSVNSTEDRDNRET